MSWEARGQARRQGTPGFATSVLDLDAAHGTQATPSTDFSSFLLIKLPLVYLFWPNEDNESCCVLVPPSAVYRQVISQLLPTTVSGCFRGDPCPPLAGAQHCGPFAQFD